MVTTDTESEIVYADEVARMLRRSIDTIRYWDRTGNVLPQARKLGRRKYWLRSEISPLIGG
ncbi:MerR family transcriptional regulator [Mycolicibacillus trivialis]